MTTVNNYKHRADTERWPDMVQPRRTATYAKEERGCWHRVVATTPNGWRAVCGVEGRAYSGRPTSVIDLEGPPSPLCCGGAP